MFIWRNNVIKHLTYMEDDRLRVIACQKCKDSMKINLTGIPDDWMSWFTALNSFREKHRHSI